MSCYDCGLQQCENKSLNSYDIRVSRTGYVYDCSSKIYMDKHKCTGRCNTKTSLCEIQTNSSQGV